MIKKNKLLFVDDDAEVLRGITRRLADAGFEVDVALDAQTAMHRLEEGEYGAVLVDLLLPSRLDYGPGKSLFAGLDLLENLKAQASDEEEKPRAAVLSVVRREEIEDRLKALGATYFNKVDLLEPGTMEKLMDALTWPEGIAEPSAEADD